MAVQQAQVHESSHPTPITYILIAVILTVITAVEVAVVFMEGLKPLLVPILLVLSAAKFVIVVGFYMHLKFDARLYTTMFAGGFLLAVAVLLALVTLFDNFYLPAA
jgi:cytochrome c oxidase subunit 4